MTVYIDTNYRCHPAPAQGLRAVETEFFEGKCPVFIEGYRFVPQGEVWRRGDGMAFHGPMLAPVRDCDLLTAAQQIYEALSPEINELRERLQRLRDCIDGLATVPSLEQLKDFLLAIREIMEDD